jgi:hypothetical protein
VNKNRSFSLRSSSSSEDGRLIANWQLYVNHTAGIIIFNTSLTAPSNSVRSMQQDPNLTETMHKMSQRNILQ